MLIERYLRWLREEFSATKVGEACRITTPFLDRFNDAIEIFVEKRNGMLLLTDDGETLGDLRASGLEFSTEKRNAHLTAILNGFGVRRENDDIVVTSGEHDFPQKKHNLIQAILAIGDLFVMGQEHVVSFFKEDVAHFLSERGVSVFRDFKLAGKGGIDHKFDFALPKSSKCPERVLQAINNLTREQSTLFAFAVADVKLIRPEPLQAFTIINDPVNPPNEEYLNVLRNYEVQPLYWSQKDQALGHLSS
ncbi:MAG: DUF1828 domain-containing protein [Nitrospirae bacterium]|nr:DUF1828 domain-containing protein [Nitrospirota bacterium]